jgi:hypothetical protein
MAGNKKKPDAMTELQAAHDALEGRVQHLPHLGGKEQQAAHDLIRRAKVLLAPEPAVELAIAMNQVSDTLDGIVAHRRQHMAMLDAARRAQQETAAHIKAEEARRRQEARDQRAAMGATPL